MTDAGQTINNPPRWLVAYQAAKQTHPDCLLLYRLGDFYEMFFDDAVRAADALDIALTKRGAIPMCGIPVHSHERYVQILELRGFRVAIHQGGQP